MANLVISKEDELVGTVITSGQGGFGNEVIERLITRYEEILKKVNKVDGSVVLDKIKEIYNVNRAKRVPTSTMLSMINEYMKEGSKFVEESKVGYTDMDASHVFSGVGVVTQPNRHSSFLVNVTFDNRNTKILQNDLLYADWITWYNNYVN